MKILGIDQSFTSTGYVIINEHDVITYGIISSPKSDGDVFTRARIITNKLVSLSSEYQVDQVFIEGLAFGGVGDATRQLSGLQFLIVDSLRPLNITIVPPTTLKKFATGKGNAKKEDMYNSLSPDIKTLFHEGNLKKTKGLYDCTDAFFLAKYGLRDIS